ncbi:MAG: UvrD-helicase domain-containing protein [Clostridia bacterium]|nr:UvrD-helicase domain-containing protein [Clostridia bacterium]
MFSLDTLNELQKSIALDTEGAKLVTAGAGSGKTRLLTHRICHIIENCKVSPDRVLAITFTNKATNEMRERIGKMIPNSNGVTIKTLHSFCAGILRANIDKLEGFDRNFSVYDSSDQDKLLKKVIKELSIDENVAKYCGHHISKAKNDGLTPEEYLRDNKYQPNIDEICKVYAEYQNQLKNNNALDFDDLLLKTLELFHASPSTLEFYQEKFKYIHVDEFQDTNLVQYKIIKLISAKYKNVFVVGDEDQCIYCWRGANIDNIKNFTKDYECKIYKLEQNYRSTKEIIKHANKLIKNNFARIDKTLFTENEDGENITYYEGYDENEEAEYVARAIYNLQSKGVDLREVGVLMRVSALSRLMEEKLLNYNIPYKVSGIFKFFERLEVKNILAYLTMIVNPRDNSSIARIINYPKRGIGQTTIDKLIQESERQHIPMVDLVENYRELEVSSTIKAKIAEFGDMITEFKKAYEEKGLYDFVEFVVETAGIKGMYNTDSEEDVDRTMNIDQLLQSVKSYEHLNEDANLVDYLESVTLQSSLDEEDDEESSVSISTVHASKGLEFDYVFIIGLEESKFPLARAMDSNDEMEEERRLMYVAVTRAKKKLYLTRAKSRFMYGKRDNQMPSRFIAEMGLAQERPKFRTADDYAYDSYSNYNGYSYNNYGNSGYSKTTYSESTSYKTPTSSYSTYDQYASKLNSFGKNNSSSNGSGLSNLQGLMANKLNNQKKNFSDYKVGVQVLHTKFGVGKIIKVDGGDNNYVSIDFGTLGVKTLSLNFAPLQILK